MDTLNRLENIGTRSNICNKAAPIMNAPIEYMFVSKPKLTILFFPLQLKPCQRRERHSVPNAIVEPVTVLIPFSEASPRSSPLNNPIIKAMIVAIAINSPVKEISFRVSGFKTDSSLGRGLSLIRAGFEGSMLIARAGKLSVIKFINKS